jgi:predicted Zn-dependent protease
MRRNRRASRPCRARKVRAVDGECALWRHALSLFAAAAFFLGQFPGAGRVALAQGAMPSVIRDAEIEELLRDYTRPVLKAAGLTAQNVQVVILNDRAFNAFVADGRRIFVFVGALTDSTTPNQIIGVLAHETGHLAGGHLARMREQLATAQTAAIIAMILSAGAIVAGSQSRDSSMSQAAPGVMLAPQETIRRTLLAYARGQEEMADRAGVKFLTMTSQSPKGMLDTFERFANDTLFISKTMDPYLQTHPMPRERIASLQALAQESPYFNKLDSPELQARHDMMRAKLYGFTDRLDSILRRYPTSNNSLPARYARAIAYYRFGNPREAIASIDSLIASQPNNPYFHELKGQALLEGGKAREAIAPLRQAVQLSNGNALIRMLLGQALVQSGDRTLADQAIPELRVALQKEPEAAIGYRVLAMAFEQKGDQPNAALSSAQAAFNEGDFKTARQLAARAQRGFSSGSAGWLKADDIVNFKPPKISQN